MNKLIKCSEHKEIFTLSESNVKRWIQNWDTFVFLAQQENMKWRDMLAKVETIPFPELKEIEVGDTILMEKIIVVGKKPKEIFYPNSNHKTDKLYKMLYVCPTWGHGNPNWLNEIEEVGFNVIHSYETDKHPWSKDLDKLLDELENRGMYGCFQLPLYETYWTDFIIGMGNHKNAILSSVEEPDASGHPSPDEQKRIYGLVEELSPDLPVWGCLNWGDWRNNVDMSAFDLIMTDSYMYSKWDGSIPVPGTEAVPDNRDKEWWTISYKVYQKIKLIKEATLSNMPVINIQQGFYTGENVYPNIEEEWKIYNKEMGLNSFAVYPHGIGQGYPSVMNDERIKKQCKELMRKLDEGMIV